MNFGTQSVLDPRLLTRAVAQRIRAVTFDVGGTLIEPWPSVGHIYAEVAARHGVRRPPGELDARFAAAWHAQSRFGHTRQAWANLVDETFRGLARRPPSETFFDELYNRFSDPAAWRVFDDVQPALKTLAARGIKLGIISNWDDRLRPLLRRLGLARWFDTTVISCEVGYPKPAPPIFAQAAQRLGLPASAILHVGDSLENDVRGARAAGFEALHLRRRRQPKPSGRRRS